MAKQTFTVGQVLTAAQLTSLQQTAMGGGAASAKTASYTLVAADAGTTISMTSTSATTITVNTGLFAAGDTVFIQNLGTGNLTITAGTATVATAGSLILPQNDAGILYFVSTSSSVFYDFIQVGAVSPLTTKGDLYGFSTLDARIPIGANNTVLTADSAQALGLKWATPASAAPTSARALVATSEGTTSATYTDLTTAGPAVTITTGTKALVIITGKLNTNTSATTVFYGFDVSGATTIAATDSSALGTTGSHTARAYQSSFVTQVTVNAGSNTFTSKYRADGSTNAQFANREIIVIDLGS
jgi:hypothetical protein